MLSAIAVTHHYGIRPVLRDVNMEIPTGDLVVLLGPNGMGKTTLLNILAGVLWPYSGHVEIDGVPRRQSIETERAMRRKIAYLPDQPWLPKARSGREFLLAVGRLYDHEDLYLMDRAERLLKLFELAKQADWPISSYSTGQQKKIALAATLITEAPYLLMDEPFSGGLDPSGILALKHVLKRLANDRSVTVVMTTPVPELVEELAHRIGVVRDGRLAEFETIDGLREKSGVTGSLDEVLQRMLYPETVGNIEEFLATDGTEKGGI